MALVIYVTMQILSIIWNKLEYWKIKQEKELYQLKTINKILVQKTYDVQEIMQVDAVRRSFVDINTEWLINNLDKVMTPEFVSHPRTRR